MSSPGLTDTSSRPGPVARLALALTDWTERWIPDAFIFALLATVIVVAAALLLTPSTAGQVVDAWGRGFWDLIAFTLQMALVIITGHVLATSPPMMKMVRSIAAWPSSPRGAVALVTLFALATSWFNWGFSLVFSAILAREVVKRVDVDYRAIAAASFLGLGSIWAQGLSGSAALQMATPGALQPQIRDIVAGGGVVPGGIISFRHTIFLWQSFVSVAVEIVVVTAVMWFATPPKGRGKTARELGIDVNESRNRENTETDRRTERPGQYSGKCSSAELGRRGARGRVPGSLLHERCRSAERHHDQHRELRVSFVRNFFASNACSVDGRGAGCNAGGLGCDPAYPFYAGIAGVITSTHLNEQLAGAFVRLSNSTTFPPLVALYSAVLGVFVPSGGSKWVIEAPYVMAASHTLKVHLGWVVSAYDLGEALANLVQPFWMLPTLGVFRLGARDVMGYTFVVFLALVPVVLLLVTLLGLTLPYPL